MTGSREMIPSQESIIKRVEEFLSYTKNTSQYPIISFYGGNFLGLDEDELIRLLEVATQFIESGRVKGLRFSTRPDTIDEARLDLIKDFSVDTIEVGAQSMDNQVLGAVNRGHTELDTINAAKLLKKRGYETGLQLMTGLPSDTPDKCLLTAKKIAELKPDFVRIYPTLVLRGSMLAKLYRDGAYTPQSLEDAVLLAKELFNVFRKQGIKVIRLGLQASEELSDPATVYAGPYHPAFGELVYSAVFFDMASRLISRVDSISRAITIKVHPGNISQVRGQKNINRDRLIKEFSLNSLGIEADDSVSRDFGIEVINC